MRYEPLPTRCEPPVEKSKASTKTPGFARGGGAVPGPKTTAMDQANKSNMPYADEQVF